MIDWTKLTKNPIDEKVSQLINKELREKREVLCTTYRDYLYDQIRGKRVLDIGVVEHSIEHMQKEQWLHKSIVKHSEYCVGVDIVSDLVDVLNEQGYNVKNVDATSKEYLGEKFDVVIIGDVIEHVENPVDLMRFAKRHCAEGGKIIVSTPNPFYYQIVFDVIKKSTFVANFEHTTWVTPSMAMEIARRAELDFSGYKFFSKCRRFPEGILEKKFPEIFKDKYCYVFTL